MANLFTNPSQAGFACTTVVDLLRFQGQQQPNQSAFTFLSEGQTESMIMTYEALDRSSRAIAAQLQAMGLQGERALLLYPPGLDYLAAFFGCLYAGVVAIPAYPPRNKRNTPRILAILEDAQAAIALTTTGIENNVRSLLTNKVASVQWLTTDNLPLELATQWQELRLSGESLAFLQYTSGSTGTPKGVMITHGNLLHNAARTYEYMEHSPESVFVSWLPAYHDMGLIGGILQPLYGGFPCILMSPTYFLQRPFRWLEAISRYGGTTSGAPNFAYELCVQKVTPEQRETLDLSRWDVAFNGAEPIRHQVLEDFAEYFAPCGFRREAFYPCYGMAEATLMVSGVEKAAAPIIKVVDKDALAQNRVVKGDNNSVSLVSCGRSLPDQQVIIANPDTLTRCEAGEVGEIWVTGPSVGKGYWNRPNATQETFQAYLAETGEGPFLRTGDLGFLENGELYVTGRAKDLIIIRGRNLYPQDIEFTAENSHPALRATGSAAFAVDVEGEERLVVVQELAFRHKADLNEVIREIRQAIAIEHEIQPYGIVLIKGGTIPKTSSGKIQRRACRSQFLAGMLTIEQCSIVEAKEAVKATISLNRKELLSLETEKQQEELEAYLKDSITVALQCSVAEMNWESPLMALGLDSLRVFQLKNAIETDLEVEIAIADLFSEMTLTELAANLLEKMRETVVSGSRISRCTPQADYPLSDAQKRLWFFDRFQPNTALYNIAGAYHLKGQVNITALEQSLNEIVRCQDSLRTYFKVVNGEARQAIASFVPLLLPILDLQNVTKEQQTQVINEEIQTPFDLGIAPLIRVKLLQLSPTHFILTVVIHHIISDGWSMGIFLQDLMGLYDSFSRGKTPQLKSLPIQYRDYAVWESQSLDNSSIHLNYWKEKLAGKLPILALPTDYPRPTVATFKGARQKQIFSQELATQLKSLSQQNGVTLYMTLLAAFKTLLYRYTGQTDLLVGSPIAGRNYRETNSLIGFFVNTLVLRTELSGEIRFTDYLRTVKETALEAYSHAAMPFEQLVQALQPTRELSHSPLFQVMFALQNMPMLSQMPSGLTGYYEELDTQTAKFDLTLFMAETKAGLSATFEYNTDLFKPETIDRMLGHFRVLLEGIVANSNQSIAKLPLLTVAEEKQLAEWNQTEVNYPLNICLHSLVEEQVEKTPNAIAVVYDHPGVETRHGASLQYRELNAKANQLAHYLQSLGVKPDTLVGVCLQRSPLMIIALLAILKAGGAYLPLDPTYPKERLAFMLTDAKVSVLLTESSCLDSLPVSDSSICLDSDWETISQYSTENPSSEVTADNIAYTIYTSGSTGNPKGAMNTHRGIVNRLLWMRDAYEVGESDRILQKTPFSFDVSVWELFLPLISGGRLVVARPDGHKDAVYIRNAIASQGITMLHFVPSMLQVFLLTTENTEDAEEFILNSVNEGGEKEDQLVSLLFSPLPLGEGPGVRGFNLKRVICSGEALSVSLQNRFFECFPGVELHNLYGPTEAAIDVTAWQCFPECSGGSVPIGKAIANTQLYILDSCLNPVPVGIPGELYIGGVGVAKGYLNRPQLTAERFIIKTAEDTENTEEGKGERLYKTGDLCRYREDGAIEFLGRLDYQVKVRGFRIELGEIESLLEQHSGIQQAVVMPQEGIDGNAELVAYVVFNADLMPTVADVRQYLRKQLPDYMLPSMFVVLASLPLNPNGKVDRKALPKPNREERVIESVYSPPKTELEETITKIWQGCLNLEKIGINDNFFDLGGHSLLLVTVHQQLREKLNLDIELVTLFEYPTIASLARYLSQQPTESLALQSVSNRAQKRKAAMKRHKKKLGR